MNLFEKIFNYQVITRLSESGVVTLTSHERTWLKSMLAHPAAGLAFAPATLDKLQMLVCDEQTIEAADSIIEKAKSLERHVYHPLLRPLRILIASRRGMKISYGIKNGRIRQDQDGFPYKLEYSMVKKEWYLLWYSLRHRMLMVTKLQSIVEVKELALDVTTADGLAKKIAGMIESHKDSIVIEIVRLYNKELSRILYAFSCFEKEVEFNAETNTYRIKLTMTGDESEYVLSKIRFLGKRIRIVEGSKLQKRMHESATKALARYGASGE